MVTVELDDETYALVRFAAQLLGVSESEVVARAVQALSARPEPEPERDPWEPLDVYAEYEGQRVEGRYVGATRRVTITSGDLAGQAFTSPSAAARAVVSAVKPSRASTPTNGWRFWRLAADGQRLDSVRGGVRGRAR